MLQSVSILQFIPSSVLHSALSTHSCEPVCTFLLGCHIPISTQPCGVGVRVGFNFVLTVVCFPPCLAFLLIGRSIGVGTTGLEFGGELCERQDPTCHCIFASLVWAIESNGWPHSLLQKVSLLFLHSTEFVIQKGMAFL